MLFSVPRLLKLEKTLSAIEVATLNKAYIANR